MKKAKVFRIISGVLFLLYGIFMALEFLYRDHRLMNGAVRLPRFLLRAMSFIAIRARDISSFVSYSGGPLLGLLLLTVFILISIGLFTNKRVLTAIGSGLGMLVQFLASFGVFSALYRAAGSKSYVSGAFLQRFFLFLRGSFRTYIQWPVLLINFLLLLVFVSLFIAALSKKAAGVFAWIGGGAAFLALLPLGLFYPMMMYGTRGAKGFYLSPLGILLMLVLTAAVIFAGLGLRQVGQRRREIPSAQPMQPRPVPAAHPGQAASRQPAGPPAQVDTAVALRNFKQLLDEGIITQEEFDAKKKQLLGL